jgi:hypothetical protein
MYVLASVPKKLQDTDKKVDNVKINVQSCKHVLIDTKLVCPMLASTNQLCIINDIEAEDDNSN